MCKTGSLPSPKTIHKVTNPVEEKEEKKKKNEQWKMEKKEKWEKKDKERLWH